jgi:hypothetical protein
VVPPTAGTYVFELSVADSFGNDVPDLMGETATFGARLRLEGRRADAPTGVSQA